MIGVRFAAGALVLSSMGEDARLSTWRAEFESQEDHIMITQKHELLVPCLYCEVSATRMCYWTGCRRWMCKNHTYTIRRGSDEGKYLCREHALLSRDRRADGYHEVIEHGGMECPNCSTWRRCGENGLLEDCPYCEDDEFDIMDQSGP